MSSPQQRPVFLRYGVAIVAVIVATSLRLWVDPVVGDSVPFPTYFLAIMLAAWYGGVGPSLFTLVLGGVVADYLFVPPRGSFWFTAFDFQDEMGVGAYVCVGIGIVLLSETIRRTHEQLLLEQHHRREQVEAELAKIKDQLVRQTRLAAIGQVSASIAHDIRNPLAGFGQGVYLLKRHLPPDQPKCIEYLELMGHEIELMNRIISNLTEMAHGKQPHKEKVDFSKVAREVFDRLDHSGIELLTKCEPEPFIVAADPVQLRQVLGNLLANAIQAMGSNGQIRIRASRCHNADTIVVEDNGPGIPPELRDQIFEPLVTNKPKGTGLGLAICRQIVERHGGSIELLTRDRPGTAFQISLPSAATG